MTTTFHYEAEEPQYESPYEGADIQLRCGGLVGAGAGPAFLPPDSPPPTWYELSSVSGNCILIGVGRCAPNSGSTAAIENREAIWAGAMAGLAPAELAETFAASGDCLYALVDPTDGHVALGGAGRAVSALIIDSHQTREVHWHTPDSATGRSTVFVLPPGSTLLLTTHELSAIGATIANLDRGPRPDSLHGDEARAMLEFCVGLRNGPVDPSDAIAAIHFERLTGSPIRLRPRRPCLNAGSIERTRNPEYRPMNRLHGRHGVHQELNLVR
jgi:hypothetical protein